MATNPGQELSSIDFASMLGGPLLAAVDAQAQAAMSSVNFIKEVGFQQVTTPSGVTTGDPIYVSFRYPREVSPYQPATQDRITGIVVTAGGSGYTSPPAVEISGGGGTGATAVASINANGQVSAITLTDPGSGYTSAPTVTLTGGDGSGAIGTASFAAATAAVPAVYQTMKLEVPILTMLPVPYLRIEDVTIDFNAKINSIEYKKVDTSLGIDASLQVQQRWPGGGAKLNVSASYKRSTSEGSNVERTYSMNVHIRAVQDEMPAGMEKILSILEGVILSQPA